MVHLRRLLLYGDQWVGQSSDYSSWNTQKLCLTMSVGRSRCMDVWVSLITSFLCMQVWGHQNGHQDLCMHSCAISINGLCVCVCVCVWFSICLHQPHQSTLLSFAGVQIQGLFSWNSNGPGGTSGAYTTCCEERPILLRVPSPAPGALLALLTVPA